jgi:general secretion pathway protein E
MVGEIRDRETAEIAVRASLTGHLVFSTLHTNDAVGAITRLTDMGIEPYLVASSLNGVLAQRLVRLSCPACAGRATSGCETCRGTGFFGRTGLFELFVVNDDLRDLIQSRAPAAALREKALALGMKTLFQAGQAKAREGGTTMEEVLRVTEED